MKSYIKKSLAVAFLGAMLFSCSAVFEDDLSNNCIVITNPGVNAELNSSSVVISWEEVDDALEYRLKIASPSFDDPTSASVMDSLVVENTLNVILEDGVYEISLQAINSSSETPQEFRSFSVIGSDLFENSSIVIVSHDDDMVTSDDDFDILWADLEEAENYYPRVFHDSNGTIGEPAGNGLVNSENSFNVNLDEGKYIFTVYASNGVVNSLTTELAFTIDQSSPSTPNLSAPSGAEILLSETIEFSWQSGVDDLSSTIDSLFIYELDTDNLVFSDEVTSPFELDSETLGLGEYDWGIVTYDQGLNYSESFYSVFTINE